MSRRAIALAVSTVAALAVVWAYAIDAALPDGHPYRTVSLPSALPPGPWTMTSVDSGEPAVHAESDAHVSFTLAEPPELHPNDGSTAWIWLLAAALLTALAAFAAALLRRRGRSTTAAS